MLRRACCIHLCVRHFCFAAQLRIILGCVSCVGANYTGGYDRNATSLSETGPT